jgi:hypothetical protein
MVVSSSQKPIPVSGDDCLRHFGQRIHGLARQVEVPGVEVGAPVAPEVLGHHRVAGDDDGEAFVVEAQAVVAGGVTGRGDEVEALEQLGHRPHRLVVLPRGVQGDGHVRGRDPVGVGEVLQAPVMIAVLVGEEDGGHVGDAQAGGAVQLGAHALRLLAGGIDEHEAAVAPEEGAGAEGGASRLRFVIAPVAIAG